MNEAAKASAVSRQTVAQRISDCELLTTRRFDVPAHILFKAWTSADLFKQWWVPKSFGLALLSCEMDVRVGGRYRLEFAHPASDQPMAFFGEYTDVIADTRIAWTNEESDEGALTTVSFAESGGATIVSVHDRYPTKDALDNEISCGATSGMSETLDQLEALAATMVGV